VAESKINVIITPEKNFYLRNRLDEEIRAVVSVHAEKKGKNAGSPGVDIIFLLDSSISMQGKFGDNGPQKNEIAVEAAKKAVDQLGKNDTITIISFNSGAILIVDHEKSSAKTKINNSIEEILKHEGNTNFEAAMDLALAVSKNRKNEHVKIVFLTDGNETAGNSQKALEQAENLVNSGATIDAMGIGGDFNYDYMKKYSAISGGLTENLVSVEKTTEVFRNILKTGQNAVAINGYLNINFEKGIRDVHLYQYFPEKKLYSDRVTVQDNRNFVGLSVGDLPEKGAKEYALSCRVDLTDATNFKLADINVSYKDPATGGTISQDEQWILNLTDNADNVMQNSRVGKCFLEIDLLIDYEVVIKDYENGRRDPAIKRLEKMIKTAEKLNKSDELAIYELYKEKIKKNENLTQADFNLLSYTSSTKTDQIAGIKTGNKIKNLID
jgi:Mg-chelatase subunit ChlD